MDDSMSFSSLLPVFVFGIPHGLGPKNNRFIVNLRSSMPHMTQSMGSRFNVGNEYNFMTLFFKDWFNSQQFVTDHNIFLLPE